MTTVSTINDNYEHFTFDYTKLTGAVKARSENSGYMYVLYFWTFGIFCFNNCLFLKLSTQNEALETFLQK